jgi:hypothetical protein
VAELNEGHERTVVTKLEDLAVPTAPDQIEELCTAYPALLAWIRIAEELARDEFGLMPPPGAA